MILWNFIKSSTLKISWKIINWFKYLFYFYVVLSDMVLIYWLYWLYLNACHKNHILLCCFINPNTRRLILINIYFSYPSILFTLHYFFAHSESYFLCNIFYIYGLMCNEMKKICEKKRRIHKYELFYTLLYLIFYYNIYYVCINILIWIS